MTKSELITEITKNPEYISLCKRMAGSSLGKDLYQEMLMILIEYSAEKIIAIKCQRCFVVKILSNMWNSSTSPFYYKYRKNESLNQKEMPINITDEAPQFDDERLEKVEAELSKLHWYDREILKLYSQEGSTRKVQKITGIHYVSISKSIRKVKQILKAKIK